MDTPDEDSRVVAADGRELIRFPATSAARPDAQRRLDQETATLQTGTWVDPGTARLTVGDWCATWLAEYATKRASTVRMAEVADIDFHARNRGADAALPGRAAEDGDEPNPGPDPREPGADSVGARGNLQRCRRLLTDDWGHQLGPWQLQRGFRAARAAVEVLAGFRFHDLRHYYASLLIASGLDVNVLQAGLRHASAKTTLDTYGHPWPNSDDGTRAAIDAVIAARRDAPADYLRTRDGGSRRHP